MSKYKLKSSKDLDEEFERFCMKESMTSSESSLDTRALASLEEKLNSGREKNWASQVYDDDEGSIGLLGTGNKFLKSSIVTPSSGTIPKPISRNQNMVAEKPSLVKDTSDNLNLSVNRDSLDQENGKSSLHPGRDTLEEMADKEKFFKEIEKNLSAAPDYSRLNRDLDTSNAGTLFGAPIPSNNKQPGDDDNNSSDDDDDDEEDEEADKSSVVNQEKSSEKPVSMLSQVALIDSLDSTIEKKPQTSQDAPVMHTIEEGTGERTARRDDSDDEVDAGLQNSRHPRFAAPLLSAGPVVPVDEDEEEEEDDRITEDTTTKGITGKTVTGYTDTGHDMEDLQKALRKVGGLETFGSSNNFTLEETSALGELADTRNKESTVTTIGGTSAMTEGQEKMSLSELNRAAGFQANSNNTAFRFQPSKRPLRHSGADVPHNLQPPSVRFNDEAQEISQSKSSENASPADELDLWFNQTTKASIKATESTGDNSLEQRSAVRLPKSSHSVADVGPKREKYTNVKSSGYGSRSPASKISAAKSLWSPEVRNRKGKPGTGSKTVVTQQGQNMRTATLTGSSRIIAGNHMSVDTADASPFSQKKSLTDMVISSTDKPMMSSSMKGQEDEVRFWNERYKNEVTRVAKLQAAMTAMEREYAVKTEQLKSDYDQKIFKLQQENFALSAKVESESESRLKRLAEVKQTDVASSDQLAQLETEMRQQDALMAGYQMENERLYEEMKKLRIASKSTEEKMFRENQKLKLDLANLREELSSKDSQLRLFKDSGATSAVSGAARIALLESELKQAKMNHEGCKMEVEETNRAKNDLEKKNAAEMKELKEELAEARNQRSMEAKDVEEQLRREVDGLKKKLKWYAENQELLDKDVIILRQKDDEIKELRVKLQELQLDTGKKTMAINGSQKQRSVDAKRILDLERQVREMETILKKRHPNSLPVLMWAAASIPEGTVAKPQSVEYLEGRIRKLESQLEEQDELGRRSTRALEQKYNQAVVRASVKSQALNTELKYEARIQELERQATKYQHELELTVHPHTTLLALQRELDSVRDRLKKQTAEHEQMIAALSKELALLRRKEPATVGSKPEALSEKNKDGVVETPDGSRDNNSHDDRRLLLETIEKLNADKQHLIGDLRHMAERLAKATTVLPPGKKNMAKTIISGKTFKRKKSEGADAGGPPLLPIYSEISIPHKEYDPETFTGEHVSDLVNENNKLRMKVEALTLEGEQQRVTLQKFVAEHEASERYLREELEEHISALKNVHQVELQRLVAGHALEHSSSQMAELRNRTSAQEVVIQHLKEQLAQHVADGKQLSILENVKSSLESQVKQLEDDLLEARSAHTPQMRHFEMLQEKIRKMESRHQQREQQLQQLLHQNHLLAAEEVAEEAAKWKKVVESKSKEIDRFRNELDSILDVLRVLQRQGVVVPYTGRTAYPENNHQQFNNHQ